MSIYPIFIMTAVDLIIIALWITVNNKLYLHLYPPRKLIIIYGSRNAETLTNKMSMREDKYMICESINIHENIEKIKKEILKFEGVIICDISGQIRNDIIKYCLFITPQK